MIERTIGKEIQNPVQRAAYLRDNADSVEPMGYMKPFSPEELDTRRIQLADVSVKIAEIEQEKELVVKEIKGRLAPLKEERTKIVSDIKAKAEYVTEDCFKFIDEESRQVGYYNKDGDLVSQRPAMADELQPRLFSMKRSETSGLGKTGTETDTLS